MPADAALRVIVCGAGAFGRNHIRIYRELQASGLPVTLVGVLETDPGRGHALFSETGIPVFHDLDSCLQQTQAEAASVCVPTTSHYAIASALLAAGLHVLIEKPIASTLAQADALIHLGRKHRRLVQVGHLERFNPAVAALATLTTNPMFFEAHRLSVFSPRALDVDVVLDLMIHDLDIVLQLAQSPVQEVRAVGLPVLSAQVDIANVRVEFESGCIANFTASRVSTERVRKLRFFQPHQYVSVDYARQDLLIIGIDANTSSTSLQDAEAAHVLTPESPSLSFDKPPIIQGEPLRLEILSFLQSIQAGTPPVVTGEQARAALALALDVQAAMQAHAARAGLHALAHPRL